MTAVVFLKFQNIFTYVSPSTGIVVREFNYMYKQLPIVLTSSSHNSLRTCLVQVFYRKKVLLVCILTVDELIISNLVTNDWEQSKNEFCKGIVPKQQNLDPDFEHIKQKWVSDFLETNRILYAKIYGTSSTHFLLERRG